MFDLCIASCMFDLCIDSNMIDLCNDSSIFDLYIASSLFDLCTVLSMFDRCNVSSMFDLRSVKTPRVPLHRHFGLIKIVKSSNDYTRKTSTIRDSVLSSLRWTPPDKIKFYKYL